MATSKTYDIEQISGAGSITTMEPADQISSGSQEMVKINVMSDDIGEEYQRLVIKKSDTNNSNFDLEVETSYLLELKIKKDFYYSQSIALRLMSWNRKDDDSIAENPSYQLIQTIYVPRASLDEVGYTNSRVVLYQELESDGKYPEIPGRENNEPKVAIPVIYSGTGSIDVKTGDIVYFNNTQQCYKVTNGGRYTSPSALKENLKDIGYNSTILNHTWLYNEEKDSDYVTYSMIFTPKIATKNLNSIYLHLLSIAEDKDLSWTKTVNNVTKIKKGRQIQLESCALYKLKNLISEDRNPTSIGVWGHPNLMLGINGEEIKIGPSGYYELHDFEITNLNVAAKEPFDRYTIDLQYPN